MNKSEELKQRLGENPEPKVVTVECGNEYITYNEDDVEDFIVTNHGGVYVVQDGEIFHYSESQVQELVYVDQGLDQEDEEDRELEEEVREQAEEQLEEDEESEE